MHRRKINTSKYITKRQLITWRIEWKFPAAGNECNIADPKVEETSTLEALLRAHLTLQPGVSVKKAELQEYIDVDFGELTVLLRKERTPVRCKLYLYIVLCKEYTPVSLLVAYITSLGLFLFCNCRLIRKSITK